MHHTDKNTDHAAESALKGAMTPKTKTAAPNSTNGVPNPRRAYPGRDAALANGRDPLNTSR